MKSVSAVLFGILLKTCIAHEDEAESLYDALREKPYFRAAILEHAIKGNLTEDPPSVIVAKNLDYYRRATEFAKSKEADIIVFPEYAIFPFARRNKMRTYAEKIPDPKKRRWNPCEQTNEFSNRVILSNLSCMAKTNDILVVAQMCDLSPCDNNTNDGCPEDGAWHHNTNVAFGRDGTLIGVYRKEHLFFERGMDLPTEPQDPVFHTDVGTFAMFASFDIIFKPMAEAGRNANIDGVLLTGSWVDTRPLMDAVQLWQSWATGTGATYIAANSQVPGYLCVGSGIFTGKMGSLKYTSHPDGLSKLILSRVPINKNSRLPFYNEDSAIFAVTDDAIKLYEVTHDEEGGNIPDLCDHAILGEAPDIFKHYRCIYEKTTNFTLVKLTRAKDSLLACNNGFCCSLSYEADTLNNVFYLAVFNGTRYFFERYSWCEEKCFIVRCDRYNGSDCSFFPSTSNTVFRRLELEARFTTDYIYPSVLKTGLRLPPVDEWSFSVAESDNYYAGRIVYSSESNKPLLVASLFGRCYDRDPPYVR